jgi:hypothetical protein
MNGPRRLLVPRGIRRAVAGLLAAAPQALAVAAVGCSGAAPSLEASLASPPVETIEVGNEPSDQGGAALLGTIGASERPGTNPQEVIDENGQVVALSDERLRFGDGREVAFDEEAYRSLIGAPAPDRVLMTVDWWLELWSPKGRLGRWKIGERKSNVVAAKGAFAFTTQKGQTMVFDAQGKRVAELDLGIGDLAVSDGGRRVLIAGYKQTALVESKTGRMLTRIEGGSEGYATAAALSPDGKRFALRQLRGPLKLLEADGGAVVEEFSLHRYDEIQRLAFVGTRVIVHARHITDGDKLLAFTPGDDKGAEFPGDAFIVDPKDSAHVVLPVANGFIRCDLETKRCPDPTHHSARVSRVCVADGGRLMLSSAVDGTVLLHRLGKSKADSTLVARGFRSGAPRIGLSTSGVALWGWLDPEQRGRYDSDPSSSLAFYPFEGGKLAKEPAWRRPTSYREGVVAFGLHGRWLVALDESGDLPIWEAVTGRPARVLPVGRGIDNPMGSDKTFPSLLSFDGSTLVQPERSYRVPSGEVLKGELGSSLERCAISPTGRALLCPDDDDAYTIARRNAEGWQKRTTSLTVGGYVGAYAVADDGAVAFSEYDEQESYRLWLRAPDPDDDWVSVVVPSRVTTLTYYAAGRRLVAGHMDGRLTIWRTPQ